MEIGNHKRTLTYQNDQLVNISTPCFDLSYGYDLAGTLINKTTPLSSTDIHYNTSGLPEYIQANLLENPYEEALEWYNSGKLAALTTNDHRNPFTYTSRGHLAWILHQKNSLRKKRCLSAPICISNNS